jgi:preprotein translocase subunit SecF
MSLQLIPPDVNLDFVGKRHFFVILSTAINVAAILLLVFVGLNYGVDFVGGSVVQVQFSKPVTPDSIRSSLAPLDLGEITVQDFGTATPTEHSFLLRFEKVKNIGSLGPKLEGELTKAFGAGVAKVVRVESVGAKVGGDLRRKGFLAVVFATAFMGIFISWQFRNVSWSFGAGAVIALVHDVLVVTGALVISQLQFDLTTLAALLTVIGYSVHDTVIVSDRIREDAAKRRRESMATIMNRAINETLSRTILTSGTAIAVLIALLAFGGPILRPSAFTLLVGFITGTYSSIYIAGPVVLYWEGRTHPRAVSRAA